MNKLVSSLNTLEIVTINDKKNSETQRVIKALSKNTPIIGKLSIIPKELYVIS